MINILFKIVKSSNEKLIKISADVIFEMASIQIKRLADWSASQPYVGNVYRS